MVEENWDRREADRKEREKLLEQISLLKQYMVRANEREDNYAKILAKHDEAIYGNSKPGLLTVVTQVVDATDKLSKSLWDPEGISKKVIELNARKEAWDAAAASVEKIAVKQYALGAAVGFIGAFFKDYIIALFTKGGK